MNTLLTLSNDLYDVRSTLAQKGIFRNVAMDALAPSIQNINGLNPAVLTQVSKNVVEYVLQARTAERLLGSKKKLLDWEKENLTIPILERTGSTTPYSDFGNKKASNTAIKTIDIGHYRFSSLYEVPELISEQYSLAGVNLKDSNFQAALEACLIEDNRTSFYGYQNDDNVYLVKGLLNDTTISDYEPLDKTVNEYLSEGDWESVRNIFVDAMAKLMLQSGANIDNNTTVRVGIPTSVYGILQKAITNLGITPINRLKEIYPNMEFISCPELDGAYMDENVMYFVAENALGGVAETAVIGYSEMGRTSTMVPSYNSYSQEIHFGTTGAVIFKPYLICRYSGV